MIENYGSDNGLTPAELLDAFHEGLAVIARDKRTSELGRKLLELNQ
jgi:hypothetical protein